MIRIKLNQQINLQRNVTFSFFFLFSAMPCSLQNLSSPQHRQNFQGIPKCNLYIREGNGTPLQYSCLENTMDRGTWQAAVHEIAKNRTRLSNFTFTFHFSLSCIGNGNGNPLQCSCLENPRDIGTWQEAVYGVTEGPT